MISKNRDESLDVIRGIAAFLVIFGHTIQIYESASENPLFNFITSVQMPLFMMVSGFAIGYSQKITNITELCVFIKKRSLSLLIPWVVWSILSYILLSKMAVMDYIVYAAYHMESAYWFLFSLWCIDIIYGIAAYLSSKTIKGKIIGILFWSGLFNLALLLIGVKLGITLLGIKYTTYYLVFFIIGWLLCIIKRNKPNFSEIKVLQYINVGLLLFFVINLSKISIVDLPDTPLNIIKRFFVSLSGCLTIFYYCNCKTYINIPLKNIIQQFSKYSLELYIIQCILIKILANSDEIPANTTLGLVNIVFYLILVIGLCFFIIKVLNINKVSRFFFFGKLK